MFPSDMAIEGHNKAPEKFAFEFDVNYNVNSDCVNLLITVEIPVYSSPFQGHVFRIIQNVYKNTVTVMLDVAILH